MKNNKPLKTLRLCAMVAAVGAVQVAYAHTGIKDSGFIEGIGNTGLSKTYKNAQLETSYSASEYNAFTITHGCASNLQAEDDPTPRKNVIASAAIFPNSTDSSDVRIFRYVPNSINSNTLVGTDVASPISSTGSALASPNDLSDDIQGATAGQGFNNFGLGLVSPNLFGNMILPILDGAVTRGFAVFNGPTAYDAKDAPLEQDVISTTGLMTFKHTIPKFKSTSCARSLVVRVAVANWCLKGSKNDTDPSRVDIWMGSYTNSQFFNMQANPEIMPNSASVIANSPGKDFWPSFTVFRDTVNNPFQGDCTTEANQYDVVIEPKGSDIDQFLKIPKGKYPTGVAGPAFWPQQAPQAQ